MANISYFPPFERAFAGMKQRLFRPFNLGKWFAIGFTAWLAMLGENGGGGSSFSSFPDGKSHSGGPDFSAAGHFIREHLAIIISIAVVVFIIVFVLSVVLAWLRARGVFMFLDNIILDRAQVSEPWHEYRREGNSLFWWSFVFGWITFFIFLAILALGLAIALPAIRHHHFDFHAGIALAVTLPLVILFLLVVSVIYLLLEDFVVPIMWKHRVTATESWRIWRRLTAGNGLCFVPYFLVRFLFSTIAGVLTLVTGICTCCCAFFLLAVPVVNAALLLPISATFRLYSLEFLRQFGSDGDCLATPAPPDLPPSTGAPLVVPPLPAMPQATV